MRRGWWPSRPISTGWALIVVSAASLSAQDSGSTGAALAGAGLGLLTGTTLGATAAILPCSQTYSGIGCVRLSAAISAAIGLGAGAAIGAASTDDVQTMATGAAIGFGSGVVAGVLVKQVMLYSTWTDVVAFGAVGAAVGTSPKGALIGFVAGSVAGVVLWQLVPGVELPDAATLGLVGLTVGALAGLVQLAIEAQERGGGAPEIALPITLRF